MRTRKFFRTALLCVFCGSYLLFSGSGSATAASPGGIGPAGGAVQVAPGDLFPSTAKDTGHSMNLTVGGIRSEIREKGVATVYIQFATNSADILPESRPQVESIKTLLAEEPAWCLNIVGHTDSTGELAYNLELSRKRATSVQRELLDWGIAADRLSAEGMGSAHPVADNGTREGRSRNRRVELVKRDCP